METTNNTTNALVEFIEQLNFDFKRGLIDRKTYEYIKSTLER